MGLQLSRGSLMFFSVVLFIGLLLVLILVPLSFSYVKRNEIAFKRTTSTNEVDLNTVYRNGRYFWGLGHTPIAFPSNFIKVSLTGDSKLSVFTETGQTLTFESVFFYRLIPEKLRNLYINFGTNYHQRVMAVATAALRNSAANLAMDQYIYDRANVTALLYSAMSTQLAATAFVYVPRTHFSLLGVDLPDVVTAQKTTFFLNQQQILTNQYAFQASQIRLETQRQVAEFNNLAQLVKQQAQATKDKLVSQANSRAFQAVQSETGKQLQLMISMLGLTADQATASTLIKLNSYLDATSNISLVSGVTQASIVQL